jgi:amino acid transporter
MNGLRRELGVWEAAALSIAIMAPTAAMALNGSLAASIAGTAVPLAFLGALITIALVSYSFIEFSRQFAHAGSVYAFNGRGLGARYGFLSGWALLLTYVVFTGASMAEIGAFFQTFLGLLGVQISWIVPALVGGAALWYLSFRDVRLSTRVTMVIEGVSVLVLLVLTAIILARGGAHGLSLQPFAVGKAGISAVGLASVFAFLSFAGFEGAATLGEETSNPTRTIPRAIVMAVFLTGAFYLLLSYTQSEGFGLSAAGVKAFASSTAPLAALAKTYVGSLMAAIIMFGATISAFSSALGTATAGSRILFAMGRDGFGPKAFGTTHPTYASPYRSLAVVMVVAFVVNLILMAQLGTNVFGWLGTIGVISLLLVYLVTQIAAIRLFSQTGRWKGAQYLIPGLAIILLAYTLWSNVYPVPAAPYNYFPYLVVFWVIVGIVIVWRSPAQAEQLGQQWMNESL